MISEDGCLIDFVSIHMHICIISLSLLTAPFLQFEITPSVHEQEMQKERVPDQRTHRTRPTNVHSGANKLGRQTSGVKTRAECHPRPCFDRNNRKRDR